jgi:hypothetical protein
MAFVLSPLMEQSMFQALLLSDGSPTVFVTRPISLTSQYTSFSYNYCKNFSFEKNIIQDKKLVITPHEREFEILSKSFSIPRSIPLACP